MATFITDSVTGLIYQLDATTSTQYTTSSTLTSNPIESGRSVVDHVIQNQDTVTISGILTRVKAKGSNSEFVIAPENYIVNLQDIKDNATPVTITMFQTPTLGGFGEPKNLITPLQNCIITSVQISKRSGPGSGDLFVDLSATKVEFADQAQVTAQPTADPSFQNDASNLQNGAGTTQTVEQEDLLDWSLRQIGEGTQQVTGG
jgi:hypothetical protein